MFYLLPLCWRGWHSQIKLLCRAQHIFNTLNRAATVQLSLRTATHANINAGINTIGPSMPHAALRKVRTGQSWSNVLHVSQRCLSLHVWINVRLSPSITGWHKDTIIISLFTASQTVTLAHHGSIVVSVPFSHCHAVSQRLPSASSCLFGISMVTRSYMGVRLPDPYNPAGYITSQHHLD